jgi:hypothetical protein
MTARHDEPKPTSTGLPDAPEEKADWCEPKLTFVEPVLTKEGDLTELTADGFFGTFTF